VKAVQASSHAELVKEAQKLVELARSNATQEQLDEQASVVAKLSEAAGTNKVVQELNDGSFRGYTLTGRTAQRFRTVITLGVLSFNKYQPTDQKIRMMDDESHPGGVYKGPEGNVQQAYVVSAPFELVEADKVGEGSTEATPLGIQGMHVIMGEYQQAPDNPQRLTVVFKKMQMKPAPDADLQPWLERLLPHNPTMDPKTGVLEVELPSNNPEGWLDHLLTIEEFQLLQGNYGSRTLLQRVK